MQVSRREENGKKLGLKAGFSGLCLDTWPPPEGQEGSGLQSPPCKGERCSASDSQNPAMQWLEIYKKMESRDVLLVWVGSSR